MPLRCCASHGAVWRRRREKESRDLQRLYSRCYGGNFTFTPGNKCSLFTHSTPARASAIYSSPSLSLSSLVIYIYIGARLLCVPKISFSRDKPLIARLLLHFALLTRERYIYSLRMIIRIVIELPMIISLKFLGGGSFIAYKASPLSHVRLKIRRLQLRAQVNSRTKKARAA